MNPASTVNDQLLMISGESGSGKSASLANLRNRQERVMYLNCESGKRLPFRNNFKTFTITDPFQVYEAFEHVQNNSDFDVIVVDTLTFLMDMFESVHVIPAVSTMQAWGQYAQFFKNLMQSHVASSDKAVIMLAHTRTDLDESSMTMSTQIPIKGALKNNGIEAYFSTVISTKKIPLKKLEDVSNKLLHITPRDEKVGFKHVFQTEVTKETIGERIRSPMGMFTDDELYIDNDAQAVLDHLNAFYS